MSKDELISKQQLQIENLLAHEAECRKSFEDIHSIIYCIGGPLNDNKLMFNHKQMGVFDEISRKLILD